MADHAGSSPKLFRTLIVLIALLVFGGIALRQTAPKPEAVAAAGEQTAATLVRTLTVVATPIRDRATLSGVIDAKRRVRIFSETNGRVLEIGAEELDAVEPDQLLVQVDPLQARVAVERGQAAVVRARSELGLAETSQDRQQSLKERAVASDSALDDANNRSRVAHATIRDVLAQLEQAQDELAKKTIRAPFHGVLASFEVELGEYVRVGQELGELLDLSTARVTIGLSDRQIVGVRVGQPALLEIEALPNESFEGQVLRVGVAARRDSRKFPVEIELDNAERRLLPGMVARIILELGGETQRILVPREAVIGEFGLRFVYVVSPDENGVLSAERRRIAVRDLPFDPGRVEVTQGLTTGDRVAVSAVQSLRDGTRVRSGDIAQEVRATAAEEGS